MALDVRILSTVNGTTTTYYLVNSSGSPTAGGSATGASTTPYSVNAKQWTQTAVTRRTIYTGGPPFRMGSSPLYAGFENVTETIEVGILGSSSDNVANLIQTLRKILNTALFGTPAILYWLPVGATNPAYFEIYSATVQEVGDWQNPAAGFTSVLTRITWERSAVGGWLSAGETLLNAVTMTNTGTGVNPNIQALGSSGKGEFTNDGQPLNVSMNMSNEGTLATSTIYLSTISSRTYDATSTGTSASPTTSTPVTLGASWFISLTSPTPQVNNGLKLRVMVRFSTFASNAQARVLVLNGFASSVSTPYATGAWIQGGGAANLVDCGGFTLPSVDRITTQYYLVYIQARSTNGASATVTFGYIEFLTYYTFATILNTNNYTNNPQTAVLDGYRQISNVVALPSLPIQSYRHVSGNLSNRTQVVGTPPRYYPGTSLYLAWTKNTATPTHATADTATVTATHAPIYSTLRGNT